MPAWEGGAGGVEVGWVGLALLLQTCRCRCHYHCLLAGLCCKAKARCTPHTHPAGQAPTWFSESCASRPSANAAISRSAVSGAPSMRMSGGMAPRCAMRALKAVGGWGVGGSRLGEWDRQGVSTVRPQLRPAGFAALLLPLRPSRGAATPLLPAPARPPARTVVCRRKLPQQQRRLALALGAGAAQQVDHRL
jgi:hypothetical protein